MYDKNLVEDLRLRLSTNDMDFLRNLSSERQTTISECIRSIIGEYRRSVEMLKYMGEALKIKKEEEAKLSHGDTKTDINDKL